MGLTPEAEHVVGDLAPERERLQHVVVLLLVAARAARGARAPVAYDRLVRWAEHAAVHSAGSHI